MEPSTFDRQPLTMAAVYEAAEALIQDHGVTTTREVRNWLQRRGFQATRDDVGRLLWLLAQELDWHMCMMGREHLYAHEPFEMLRIAAPAFDTYVGRVWLN